MLFGMRVAKAIIVELAKSESSELVKDIQLCCMTLDRAICLGLYGQVNKCIRWMPWQLEAMKDVVACEKPRGAGKQALIRGCPNGETHLSSGRYSVLNS